MTIQFSRDDELIRRELGFDGIYNLQNEPRTVFKISTVLNVQL